jgi:hypothetical protein
MHELNSVRQSIPCPKVSDAGAPLFSLTRTVLSVWGYSTYNSDWVAPFLGRAWHKKCFPQDSPFLDAD